VRRVVGAGLVVLDAACAAAALLAAWGTWCARAPELQADVSVSLRGLWGLNPWMPPGVACALAWVAAMHREGLHDPARLEDSVRIARGTTRAALWVSAFVIGASFLIGARSEGRVLVGALLIEGWVLVLVARLLVFRLVLRLPRPPVLSRAAIVGVDEDARALGERMLRDARHGTRFVGYVDPEDGTVRPAVDPAAVLGTTRALVALTNREDLDTLVVAARSLPRDEALRLAVDAERLGLRVLQAPFGWGVVSPRVGVARVGDVELVELAIREGGGAERSKRAFDVGAVVVVGLMLAPVLVLVALAVRLHDGGPALYVSRRVGRGGRAFDFYKFRTMRVGADRERSALAPRNESDGRLFKVRDDPRVTPLGRVLRRSSVDELPQLFNVLRGDMHLVGPRPLPEEDLVGLEHDPELQFWFEQRHRVRPGITGPWQVSGRAELGFAEMVRHDIRYIQDWSPWRDLLLLLKTVPAVLRGRGAR
jgi:exopolysaccharide biosynthesis polyprenyl glycosylphosphotransferase